MTSDGFSKNYFANQNYQSFRMLIITRFRSINIEMTEKRYNDKNYFSLAFVVKKTQLRKINKLSVIINVNFL